MLQQDKSLQPLKIGDKVRIQNQTGNHPLKWDKTGSIVEVRQFHQYLVRLDGSGRLSLRNRKFLRRYTPIHTPTVRRSILDDITLIPQPTQAPSPSRPIDPPGIPSPPPAPTIPMADHTPTADQPADIPTQETRMPPDTPKRPISPARTTPLPSPSPSPPATHPEVSKATELSLWWMCVL